MKYVPKKPKRIPFTASGFAKLKTEFADLTEKRKSTVVDLRTAREMGDLSENAAYKVARFELSGIDRRLRRLTYLLRYGTVVTKTEGDAVDFGKQITIRSESGDMTFELVGGYESNPKEGKLSIYSPIGKAVQGRKVGETVTVEAPKGLMTYTIISIE